MTTDIADPLSMPVSQLQEALAEEFPGREREWTGKVDRALGDVENGLRQHAGLAETPNGLFAGVDMRRPTYLRRLSGLRLELSDFSREVRDLRERVRQAGQAFRPAHELLDGLDGMPPPAARRGVPHFGELRDEVADFLGRLHQHCEEETRIVLESVTTDIGAGD